MLLLLYKGISQGVHIADNVAVFSQNLVSAAPSKLPSVLLLFQSFWVLFFLQHVGDLCHAWLCLPLNNFQKLFSPCVPKSHFQVAEVFSLVADISRGRENSASPQETACADSPLEGGRFADCASPRTDYKPWRFVQLVWHSREKFFGEYSIETVIKVVVIWHPQQLQQLFCFRDTARLLQ